MKLEVGRPTGTPNQFFIVGTSGSQSPAANVMNTDTDISIPVQAGEIVGMHTGGTAGVVKACGSLVDGFTTNYLGSSGPAPAET
jgi:hypothetical protein